MANASSSSSSGATCELFLLENFRLQCGETLREARLAYKTYGTLNRDRSNVVLYPTSYGAHHSDIDWIVGPERILDSSRYFVVIPNMFGNGLSTSPSNTEGHCTPPFSHVDNVTAQRRMLNDVFGIRRLALAYGWSMGAQQALHWGALFPDAVERIVAVCGTAKTTPHNWVFLDGLRAILMADDAWAGDHFTHPPQAALKAFGRVYAGWALSQAFYREQIHLQLGYESLEDFLVRDWEASFLRRDAGNLLSMIDTWKRSDISNNATFDGDIGLALRSIAAKTYIIPGQTDLYFTSEDCQREAQQIPRATFSPIPSIWGHRAGNPAKNPADQTFLRSAVAEILSA
nr:alpha/beta fold hydrolase [Schlesneria paludicola]